MFDDALRVAGTYEHLALRRRQQSAAAGASNVIVDSVPAELAINVVNAYWRVKRAGVL